ncbi:MAG TPA: potassium channel family protein [Humibacillus xanthopallidus]|nr:potassium channel family protein [Humibacillus xanthopallidus]
MFTALRAMFRDPEGKVILVWATAQVLLGTLVYRWLEHWSVVDSLYFSVVTLATVGFGDLHPTTDAAKLFTVLYILSGLGILSAFISELTKHRGMSLIHARRTLHLDTPDASGGTGVDGGTAAGSTPTDDERA